MLRLLPDQFNILPVFRCEFSLRNRFPQVVQANLCLANRVQYARRMPNSPGSSPNGLLHSHLLQMLSHQLLGFPLKTNPNSSSQAPTSRKFNNPTGNRGHDIGHDNQPFAVSCNLLLGKKTTDLVYLLAGPLLRSNLLHNRQQFEHSAGISS